MDLTSRWDVEKLLGSPEILANITSLDSFHEKISRSSYDRIYSSVDSCWEEAKRYLKKIQDLMRQ
jgi:hypothetical protein